jgi:hypothetical protein
MTMSLLCGILLTSTMTSSRDAELRNPKSFGVTLSTSIAPTKQQLTVKRL